MRILQNLPFELVCACYHHCTHSPPYNVSPVYSYPCHTLLVDDRGTDHLMSKLFLARTEDRATVLDLVLYSSLTEAYHR